MIYSPWPIICNDWNRLHVSYEDWNNLLKDLAVQRAEIERRFAGTDIPFADCITVSKYMDICIRFKYAVYYREGEKWVEDFRYTHMKPEAVPEAILSKPEGADGEVDITEEVEHELAARRSTE